MEALTEVILAPLTTENMALEMEPFRNIEDIFESPNVSGIVREVDRDDVESQNESDPGDDNAGVLNERNLENVEVEDIPVDLGALMWEVVPFPVARAALKVFPSFELRDRDVGVKIRGCNRLSPGSLFKKYFSEEVMRQFVDNSNSFARRTGIKDWEDVDVDEMYKFYAVLIVFSISTPPERRMAWRHDMFYIPILSHIMSCLRFEQIMRAWHWIDSSTFSEAEVRRMNREDPFWTVQSLIESFTDVSRKSYWPGQTISIDEQCIPFKGRHKCRCYNPNKPVKWHFKVFALNDAVSGYQWDFYLYRGKEVVEEVDPTVTATMKPCLYLTDYDVLKNKNYMLYTDNWYTSIPLLLKLRARGIHLCGTVKGQIRGTPYEHRFAATGRNKKVRGDMNQVKTTVGEFDVYYISWMDRKPVHLISSYLGSTDLVTRAVKQNGRHAEIEVTRPSIVGDYNYGMGGTDKIDQKLSYYRCYLKTRHWKRKIYAHLLNIVLVNSHILYKESRQLASDAQGFRLINFMEMVIKELAFPNPEDSLPVNAMRPVPSARRRTEMWVSDPSRLSNYHEPMILSRKGDTIGSSVDPRRTCRVCFTKVCTFCIQCNVALCFATQPHAGNKKSCWHAFHNLKCKPK